MAGVLLTAAVAGGELALRLMSDGRDQPAVTGGDDQLTEPSGTAYRRLPRLRNVVVNSPDSGGEVALSVNSYGLRGPEPAIPKPVGVYRILCLGDETMLGPYVAADDTVPARLQQLLQAQTSRPVEVLNAGVPGECPLLAWLRLRHSLIGLQPDLIVLHIDMTDVVDDRRCRRETRLDASGSPIACPHPATRRPTAGRPWWRNLQLADLLLRSFGSVQAGQAAPAAADSSTAWLRDNPPDWDLYVQQSLSPLEEIQRAATGIGAALVVSTCPQPWQVSADASGGPGVREAAGVAPGLVIESRVPFKAIADFARTRGILCCDASIAFREFPEPVRLYFRNAPDLSRLGNELYARVLCRFLTAHLSGSPSPSRTSPTGMPMPSEGNPNPNRPGGVTISFDGRP